MENDFENKLKALVNGQLPDDQVKELIRLPAKDADRFWTYLQVLQDRVSWTNTILLRVSEHLYIVRKGTIERIVKCDCGQEFGDYRINWKLSSLISVRKTPEELEEVYNARIMPNPEHLEVREFYCPGCMVQLGVEVAPHGYPIVFELLPDLDLLYRDWLGQPLSDESSEWFQDLSWKRTAEWVGEPLP